MSIHALSNEVVIQIIKFARRDSLPALSQCSSRLCELTKPVLYSKLAEKSGRSLARFLRTILTEKNSYLARYVKSFVGQDRYVVWDMSTLTVENRAMMERAVYSGRASEPHAAELMAALLYADVVRWDALATLLLIILPNLEMLEVEIEDCCHWHFINLFLQQRLHKTHLNTLLKLRGVTFSYVHPYGSSSLGDLLPFLEVESVKRFLAYNIGDQMYEYLDLDEASYKATDVSLSYSRLGGNGLRNFLRAFPQLKRLEVSHAPNSHSISSIILDGLSQVKDGLEELTFTNGEVSVHEAFNYDEFEPIGSLVHFQKLKTFETSAHILWGRKLGIDMAALSEDDVEPVEPPMPTYSLEEMERFFERLPASLNVLTIHGCTDRVYECFVRIFLCQIPLTFKTVNLLYYGDDLSMMPPYWDPVAKVSLEELALKGGVVLTQYSEKQWNEEHF